MGSYCLKGTEFLLGMMKKIWRVLAAMTVLNASVHIKMVKMVIFLLCILDQN